MDRLSDLINRADNALMLEPRTASDKEWTELLAVAMQLRDMLASIQDRLFDDGK